MPVREGHPNCPCPEKKYDNFVKLSQDGLMLCAACDTYRFPLKSANSTGLKINVSRKRYKIAS